MKLTHVVLATLGSAALFTIQSTQAQVITQWSFPSTASAPDNSPAPTTGTGTATTLGMTNTYTYAGTSATNSVAADDVLSTTGTVSGVVLTENTWRIRGAYQSTGVAPNNGTVTGSSNVNGWNINAPQYSQGAQFNLSTSGYQAINVSFDWFSTNQGIRDLQFQYNTNINNTSGWTNYGGTTAAGTYLADSNSFYSGTTPNISINLSSIAGVNNDSNFGIRLVSAYDSTGNLGNEYASATLTSGGLTQQYNNSSGNWRFDNITISGVVATPEPTSWLLGAGAIGFFFIIRRLRPRA